MTLSLLLLVEDGCRDASPGHSDAEGGGGGAECCLLNGSSNFSSTLNDGTFPVTIGAGGAQAPNNIVTAGNAGSRFNLVLIVVSMRGQTGGV